MSEQPVIAEKPLGRFERHRFAIMIAFAIGIALFLVAVALALYVSSGAVQLDLSRPGYVSVRKEASESTSSFDGFSANGVIDKKVLGDFRKQYTAQVDKATKLDAFGGDVMSDQALSIDAPTDQTASN